MPFPWFLSFKTRREGVNGVSDPHCCVLCRKECDILHTMIETANKLEFPVLRDPRYPMHQVADRLEPYLRLIVEWFHPEKIILFGSYAYGQPSKDSDTNPQCVQADEH